MSDITCSCNKPERLASEVFERSPSNFANELISAAHSVSYPANFLLFSERDPTQNVYVVVEGAVKLSINSPDGRRLILHIAKKCDIVGLASALSGRVCEMTAETIYPAKLAVLSRRDFLAFLFRHPEEYQSLGEELSHQFIKACDQLRNLGLSSTAPERLARLLLDWSDKEGANEVGARFHFSLTHQEIGEFIGASRETVTRTLSEFKSRQLIFFQGATLTIPNKGALQSYTRC